MCLFTFIYIYFNFDLFRRIYSLLPSFLPSIHLFKKRSIKDFRQGRNYTSVAAPIKISVQVIFVYKDFERDLVAHKCFLKEQSCCNFFMPHFLRASPLLMIQKRLWFSLNGSKILINISKYLRSLKWRGLENGTLFKANNRNTRKRWEICSKLTIKLFKVNKIHWRRSGIFI